MPGGMGGGGMGGGRGGDMGRGGGDPEQMREMRDVMMKALEGPARLTITYAGSDITFTDDDGRSKNVRHQQQERKAPVRESNR